MRLEQVGKLHKAIATFQKQEKGVVTSQTFLCGDFNGEETDSACVKLVKEGNFSSGFYDAKGREPGVTHHNHRDLSVHVDFVWTRNTNRLVQNQTESSSKDLKSSFFQAQDAYLLPKNVSDKDWPKSEAWDISDHRPVVVEFKFVSASDTIQ